MSVSPPDDPGADPLFAGPGEMAALMRAEDWAATPLGPSTQWPQSLRTVVRILLTSRYQMWMGWGPELRFFYNDAYRPTLGFKHPSALGESAREVWAEIWPTIGPLIEQVLSTGVATWNEGLLLFLERNGYPEETYHTFSYSPLSSDAGAIDGLLCVVTEETERVIGERRIALLRELAAHLASSKTTDEVLRSIERSLAADARDLPFTLTYFFDEGGASARPASVTGMAVDHPAAAAMAAAASSCEAPTVIDLPPAIAWPRGPWDAPPVRALVVPISQQGQPRPAGAFVAGLNPHRPVDDAYRAFVGLFVGQIAAGLANARAYEHERQRAEALAELDRAKTAFFANVSHEFRTPLTLLLGPLGELLADAEGAPHQHAQLALMHRNGQRLLKLVNTILEFTRIEAGRVRARYQPVDLGALTADLASVFRAATDKAGLRLIVDTADLGAPVHVDREMWEKIVLNLLSNAFKFTLDGEIEVRLRRDGDRAVLAVRDTGTGIPPAELAHLFERFHRVEGARGRTLEGTGIGLALVQELVKLHGGTIAVDSEVDRGTTFTVSIPFGADHLPAEAVVAAAAAAAGATDSSAFIAEAMRWLPEDAAPVADAPAAGRERIVLADDNADMRDYIRRLLASRWQVEAVGNGREALRAIERQRPDLVITDVMMPELDGFGLVHELRRRDGTRELPVLMLSARAGEESRVEGLEAGATDYLVKPFSARELCAHVESLLLRGRIRSVQEAEARRVARVFAQAPVGIAMLRGPDHVYELANGPYLELVGDRAILGKPIRLALPELAGQGIYERLDDVFTSGQPYVGRSLRTELYRSSPDHPDECFFDFVYQPLFDGDGRVEGVAVVCFDVTELAKARRAAEVANRAKDEFLAMLGHELRNPLAPIVTALQLMRLRGVAGAGREQDVIERQVHHLIGLVDDLLDVSRITRGKVQLKRQRIELADVVANAIETASPLFERHRHDLRLEVPRPLVVDGDPARLAQVVSNLLTNAAKYTQPGGRVTLRGERDDDQIVLRVRDTGIGIEPAMLAHIFDPFTQEQQALDRSQGGLGLGLAIVRSLVELHGGAVAVHSDGRGRGTEFVVRLPAADGQGAHAAGDGMPAIEPPPAPSPRRILVVDDNEDAAVTIAETLELFGYETRFALDGPSALESALTFRPDVAILDIGLPVMDGFELAQQFGTSPDLRATRLIALTGYGQEQDKARSAAAGFLAHMVKPVDLDRLRKIIDALVEPS